MSVLKFKGTPGPWHVHINPRYPSLPEIVDANGHDVADASPMGKATGKDDADAALIAQAPAMLEALVACEAALKFGEPTHVRRSVTHYLISGAEIHGPLNKVREILAALRAAGAIE